MLLSTPWTSQPSASKCLAHFQTDETTGTGNEYFHQQGSFLKDAINGRWKPIRADESGAVSRGCSTITRSSRCSRSLERQSNTRAVEIGVVVRQFAVFELRSNLVEPVALKTLDFRIEGVIKLRPLGRARRILIFKSGRYFRRQGMIARHLRTRMLGQLLPACRPAAEIGRPSCRKMVVLYCKPFQVDKVSQHLPIRVQAVNECQRQRSAFEFRPQIEGLEELVARKRKQFSPRSLIDFDSRSRIDSDRKRALLHQGQRMTPADANLYVVCRAKIVVRALATGSSGLRRAWR